MPPPLGSERIMFLGSLSVIPSIYSSIQPTITQVTNQPTDFLSIHLSIHLGSFRAFSWEHMGGMARIWHADISWPPSEVIRFWSWSVNFPNFGNILI